MPKKKLRKTKWSIAIVQPWITYMDYFATGEGRCLDINFCYAKTSEEAIQKHLDRFYGKDTAAHDYFGVGVEATPLESKRAKEVLREIFKKSDGIIKVLREAGQEFFWRFRFNYS